MSTFVHPENQKIIWNIINNNNNVNDYFQTHTNVSKEQWFRSIIEKFYMQNKGKNLPMNELNQLNKDVLTFMIKSIHSIPQQEIPPQSQPTTYETPTRTTYSSQIQTPPYVPNNIAEYNNREFEEKKQEYEKMYAKPVPQEVDFKETEKDGVIENMDELINKHVSEREQQLKDLTPRIVSDEKPVVAMPNKDISNNISIQEEILQIKTKMNQLEDKFVEMSLTLNEKIQSFDIVINKIENNMNTLRVDANKIKKLDQEF